MFVFYSNYNMVMNPISIMLYIIMIIFFFNKFNNFQKYIYVMMNNTLDSKKL